MSTAVLVALALALALAGVAILRLRRAERTYRVLLENLPQSSVVLFDHDLRLKVVVGPGVRQAGVRPADVEGKRLEEVVSGEQGEVLTDNYRAALRGESRSFEYRPRDSAIDYWLRVVPVRGRRDQIVGGMAIAQDVSDRKRAERERERAEGGRRLMSDAINEAYVVIDSDGLVSEWNDSAERMFGYRRSEAIGREAKGLIVPERDHAEFDWLHERFTRGERRDKRLDLRTERTGLHRDGGTFPIELSAATLEHAGEVSLHTFMHDISERKAAERRATQGASDLEALAEAARELARSTDPVQARRAICGAAAAVAGSEVSILFEPEPSGRGLLAVACEGADVVGEVLPFIGAPSGAGRAFASRQHLFVADLRESELVTQAMVESTGTASALWVPIVREDATLGVIAVAWRERVAELSERLERIMTVVAGDAAGAIERAALLDRLARMARTDELTGLPNRRAWEEELARELARARREGSRLSVAMLDLDHFKAFNDRHGHQAGDRLLKEAAGAWRGVLRETDVLARYGGEEFAVALPACESEEARQLVERLRAVTPDGESCSAGIVVWDRKENGDKLIGRADGALYAAKQGGRDRTVIA